MKVDTDLTKVWADLPEQLTVFRDGMLKTVYLAQVGLPGIGLVVVTDEEGKPLEFDAENAAIDCAVATAVEWRSKAQVR